MRRSAFCVNSPYVKRLFLAFKLTNKHICDIIVDVFNSVFKGGEEMKKELYSDPELELVEFSVTDVILTSPTTDNDEDQGEWDEV